MGAKEKQNKPKSSAADDVFDDDGFYLTLCNFGLSECNRVKK